MSKQPNIKWRDSDNKELQRLVKNFNAKITRLEKKGFDPSLLPERMTMKKARADIETRGDYRRLTGSLDRFTDKGAETVKKSSRGARATAWEIDEFKRNQRAENRRRKKEAERVAEHDLKVAGKSQKVTLAEMGRTERQGLKPSRAKFNNLSQEEWKRKSEQMERAMRASYRKEQKEGMRQNYIKGLKENGFISSEDDYLEEVIMSVDLDDFVDNVNEDETATFFFYKDNIVDFETRKDNLIASWEAVKEKQK